MIQRTCRGKNKNKGWIYGYYVKANRHWCKKRVQEDWIITSAFQKGGIFAIMGRFPVIPETVGYYTQLQDINNIDIYEGDIVKDRKNHIGYIEFLPEKGGFAIVYKTHAVRLQYIIKFGNTHFETNVEVIGNIYDNPELLAKQYEVISSNTIKKL